MRQGCRPLGVSLSRSRVRQACLRRQDGISRTKELHSISDTPHLNSNNFKFLRPVSIPTFGSRTQDFVVKARTPRGRALHQLTVEVQAVLSVPAAEREEVGRGEDEVGVLEGRGEDFDSADRGCAGRERRG